MNGSQEKHCIYTGCPNLLNLPLSRRNVALLHAEDDDTTELCIRGLVG